MTVGEDDLEPVAGLARAEHDVGSLREPREVLAVPLGDVRLDDEVEVVVGPLVEAGALGPRTEEDEPDDLWPLRDPRDERVGPGVEACTGVKRRHGASGVE